MESIPMRRREVARKIFLSTHRIIGLFAARSSSSSGSAAAARLSRGHRRMAERAAHARRAAADGRRARSTRFSRRRPPRCRRKARPERLTLPRHAHAAAIVSYMVETDDLDTYFHQLFVDPYTAKVTGSGLFRMATICFRSPWSRSSWPFTGRCCSASNNAYFVGADRHSPFPLDSHRPLSLAAAQWRLAAGPEDQMGRQPGEDRL